MEQETLKFYTWFLFPHNRKTRVLLGAEDCREKHGHHLKRRRALQHDQQQETYKLEWCHFHNGRLTSHVWSQVSFVSHARIMRLAVSTHKDLITKASNLKLLFFISVWLTGAILHFDSGDLVVWWPTPTNRHQCVHPTEYRLFLFSFSVSQTPELTRCLHIKSMKRFCSF